MPPITEYQNYLAQIWDNGQVTNQGPLLSVLERRLEQYLGVPNLQFVTNGTLALQIALRAFNLTSGEIITTPFSYVATTSAILWEGCSPVFVDIDPRTLCIDPSKIEAAITKDTKALMPVHIFGNPCDIEQIEKISKRYNLKVIYDGAHAFGTNYGGKPLLSYGDISTCSFHATKLFHTIEGGCIISPDKAINEKIDLIKRFGHNGDDHLRLGINAKASEFHAAMGLCNLKYIDKIIKERKVRVELYDSLLKDTFERPLVANGTASNYAYYPIILDNHAQLQQKIKDLNKKHIYPRRYFYPALNTLPYLKDDHQSCPVAEDIATRIMCLPLYSELDTDIIHKICEVLKS